MGHPDPAPSSAADAVSDPDPAPDAAPIAEQDVRAPKLALAGAALVVITLLIGVAAVVAAVGRLGDDSPEPVVAEVLIEAAASPVALTPVAGGGFVYAEQATGAIRRVGADGVLMAEPVAQFEVAGDPRARVLGLVEVADRLFASLVRAGDGALVVVRVDDGREVWVGPPGSDPAGSAPLVEVDGRILVGLGELLLIDPAGPSDQVPEVLSTGWNGPVALARTADGTIWVADGGEGSEPERLGRGGEPAARATELDGERAPRALVDLGDGRLGVCGFVSGTLAVVDIGGADPEVGDPLVTPCRTGAAVLADGRIVTATETQLLLAEIPAER